MCWTMSMILGMNSPSTRPTLCTQEHTAHVSRMMVDGSTRIRRWRLGFFNSAESVQSAHLYFVLSHLLPQNSLHPVRAPYALAMLDVKPSITQRALKSLLPCWCGMA